MVETDCYVCVALYVLVLGVRHSMQPLGCGMYGDALAAGQRATASCCGCKHVHTAWSGALHSGERT